MGRTSERTRCSAGADLDACIGVNSPTFRRGTERLRYMAWSCEKQRQNSVTGVLAEHLVDNGLRGLFRSRFTVHVAERLVAWF